MLYYAIKILVSATVIVLVSELAKRNTFLAAVVASLPLTSLLAFIWLYWETGDTSRVYSLSLDVLWLVIPSLSLFVALPFFLRLGYEFWISMTGAIAVTALCYAILLALLRHFGVRS